MPISAAALCLLPRHRARSRSSRAQRVQGTSHKDPAHGGWGGGGSVRCPHPNPPSPRPGRPRLPVRVLVSPGGRSRRRSVWAIGVFGPLQLHFEPLHADLEAVHGLDGGLRAGRVVEAHEAWRDTRDEGLGFHWAAPAGRGEWGEGREPRAGAGPGPGPGGRRPLPALPPRLRAGAGLKAPPPGPRPRPASRPPRALVRLASPGVGASEAPGLPNFTSSSGGALSPGQGARGTVGLGQAPAPHPGRPRHLSPLLRWERADTPAGGGVYWTLSSLTGGGLAAGGHRVPAWGERGVRGRGRGGTTERTSPPFGATPLASAAGP